MSRKFIAIGSGIVVVAIVAYLYFASPLIALKRMQTAFNERDHETFSNYIDFEKLRSSMREELAVQAAFQAAESDNPFDQLGAAGAAAIVDPMIERLVNPTAVRIAFERRSTSKDNQPSLNLFNEFRSAGNVERSGLNTFTFATKDGSKLMFERNWFKWNLVGIQLPAVTQPANSGVPEKSEELTVEGGSELESKSKMTDPMPDEPFGHGGAVHRDDLQADCEAGDEFACEHLSEMRPHEMWYQF